MIKLNKPLTELLKEWQEQRLLTPLDRHFALQMHSLHADSHDLFTLICALLSRQLSTQHTCLPLDQIDLSNPLNEQQSQCQILLSVDEITAELAKLTAVGIAPPSHDAAPQNKPLILDGHTLYLQRYYQFESRVADKLKQLAKPIDVKNIEDSDAELAAKRLACLFPSTDEQEKSENNPRLDWQKIATATALTQKLAVITGGPGTGKTTTVTKLLLLLCQEQAMTIRLVAPTGKAAARLSESIKASKARLTKELAAYGDTLNLDALNRIPEEAATLHRLLGVIPKATGFRHNRDNPLRLDLLIVDEASMVDLPMMYKLLDALPENARLILLGDQDQLASVEAGAVLADICAGLKAPSQHQSHSQSQNQGQSKPHWQMRYSATKAALLSQLTMSDMSPFVSADAKLGDSLVMLMHSHRFKGDAGIGMLASAVNQSDLGEIQRVWQQGFEELNWIEHGLNEQGSQSLLALSVTQYRPYLTAMSQACDPLEIIELFNQYRILCAMRAGDYGVDGINLAVTQALSAAKLISPKAEFYPGRPIIIQSNDYNLGLFNGDIGLILQDAQSQRLMAYFVQADGALLKVLPARLPQHDTCFAMTVHKSQGSEFANVSLVLPPKPSVAQQQLLTKELVYTAITRAKQYFSCLGSQRIFEAACTQATKRASGLAKRLWH
ncbi:exodeoxyribonuclease V subunit alpha [Shewanella sp. AS1]|uniref:exodeoxyribonuclease V subunit alpha n=1 Tax=Shewanella sp. AS1 TaxID=2907626 RepID=UPI001F257BE0|nr:exodeoxyribonuclease V subunit alpha [Shewanella sp. AS1]MCE9678828.1 exodeoxyribonuclease V subunit alpha [Shewanella sp. AS1]